MVLILPKNNHNSGREKGWAKCWEQQIIKGKNWIKIILSKTTSMTDHHQVRHYLLTVIISKIYFQIYVIYLWGVPSKNLRVKGAWGLVPATPPPRALVVVVSDSRFGPCC